MSPDEWVVFAASAVLAVAGWWHWYMPLTSVRRLGAAARGRRLLALTPLLCALALVAALRLAASFDVRDSSLYLTFYVVVGAAWVRLGSLLFPLLGLSPRDDVIERGNGAAALAVAGALLGLTFVFAGGNVGDGPGWWVVLFSAGLATAGLAVAWYLLERLSHVADVVTIDRDPAGGLRLGAALAACGLILGRAVAGDWVSTAATVTDFARVGWPALLLVAAAAAVERVTRPTADSPAPQPTLYGGFPAVLYLAAAMVYVLQLGTPG
jgi:uncharacterized membrane protein YjfL (UPF0719 family)